MSVKYIVVASLHAAFVALILRSADYVLPSITAQFTSYVNILACLGIIGITFGFTKKLCLSDKIDPTNKAVLITGCDTGFGHLLARRLDSKGYIVFAGCLFKSGPGATQLKENCSNRLKIIELDVTKDYSVDSVHKYVKENLGKSVLWAVVNNAGIAKGWGVEFSTVEEFKETMEVNAFGMLRVTKAFLPLIRRSKGRIVNVTSDGARIPVPHITPYCMSKYAAAGFNDCLRQEIAELGVKVISVEPEMFRTPLTSPDSVNKRFDWMLDTVDDEVKSGYGKKYLWNLKTFKNLYLQTSSTNLNIVINDLELAICSVYPDCVYKPRGRLLSAIALQFYQMMPAHIQDFCFRAVTFLASSVIGLKTEVHNISKFID